MLEAEGEFCAGLLAEGKSDWFGELLDAEDEFCAGAEVANLSKNGYGDQSGST